MKSKIQLLLYSFLFISLNCSFQSTLFKEINSKYKGKNLVISPLSIFQVLSLTANGASGTTQKEMLKVLEVENIETLNKINYEILERLKKLNTVKIANAVMTRVTPSSKFSEISEKYCAPTQILKSAKQVNDWCSDNTNGVIKSIIDDLKNNVFMILLNAIYFNGQWEEEFSKYNTKPKTFYNLGKIGTSVDTMEKVGHLNYFEDEKIQAVELPFMRDRMSAVIILPKNDLNLNDYISSLTNPQNHLFLALKKLHTKRVQLQLPKFELDFSISIKNELKNLGMLTAFKNNADFRTMTEKDLLKIDDIFHKTYLKVKEDGVIAASVTKIDMDEKALLSDDKIYKMEVNRPFLFLIQNYYLPKDHNMLFMAKIEIIKTIKKNIFPLNK